MRKKFLAVVLCLMTAVAFMPTFAFAADAQGTCGGNHAYNGVITSLDDEDIVEVVKEPTCTEAGKVKVKCTKSEYCDALVEESIAALGHDYTAVKYDSPDALFNKLVADRAWTGTRAEWDAQTWGYGGNNKWCYAYVSQCSVCGAVEMTSGHVEYVSTASNPGRIGHTAPANPIPCAKSYVCEVCGETVPVAHPADCTKGTESVLYQAANCTDKYDHYVYLCKDCGAQMPKTGDNVYTIEKKKEAAGHVYKTVAKGSEVAGKYYKEEGDTCYELTVTQEPTCAAEGKGNVVCTVCGEVRDADVAIAKLEHTYGEKVVAPTCTAEGYKIAECTVCHTELGSKGDIKAALGHDYVGTMTKEPTCEEAGIYTVTCSRCTAYSHEYTNAVAKTAAENLEEGIAIPSTKATGHDWSASETVKEATCEDKALDAPKCKTCGLFNATKVKQIGDPLGHDFIYEEVPATCWHTAYKEGQCSRCDAKDVQGYEELEGKCDYSEWTVTKEATIFAQGVQKLSCSKCGDIEWEGVGDSIPKLAYAAPTVKVKKGKVIVTVKAQADAVKYVVKAGKKSKTVTKAGKVTLKKVGKKGKKVSVKITAYNAAGVKAVSKAKKIKVK